MKSHAPYDPFRHGKAWHAPVLMAFLISWCIAAYLYDKVTGRRRL